MHKIHNWNLYVNIKHPIYLEHESIAINRQKIEERKTKRLNKTKIRFCSNFYLVLNQLLYFI